MSIDEPALEATQHPRSAWPLLETRLLATLCAVAAHGHFRRAAESLGYTQSAVSQHIAALERRVGTRLIERSPSGAQLTPAGEVLVGHAQEIVQRLQVAQADVEGQLLPTYARARVATAPGPSAALAAAVVTGLARVGRIGAAWQEAASGTAVLDAVTAGRVEFGVAELADLGDPSVKAVALVAVPLQFVWDRAACPLDRFSLEALDGLTVVGYRSCSATRAAIASLRLRGVEPRPLILSDDGRAIESAVSAGAVALVHRDLVSRTQSHRSVASDVPGAQLAVVVHNDRTVPGKWLDVVRAVVARWSRRLAVDAVSEAS